VVSDRLARKQTYAENGVNPSEGRLQGRRREQIRTSIPANVLDTMELIGDLWDGRRNNRLVQRHEKDGEQ